MNLQIRPNDGGNLPFYAPARDLVVLYPKLIEEVFGQLLTHGDAESIKDPSGRKVTEAEVHDLLERFMRAHDDFAKTHEDELSSSDGIEEHDRALDRILRDTGLFDTKEHPAAAAFFRQVGQSVFIAAITFLRSVASIDATGDIIYGDGVAFRKLRKRLWRDPNTSVGGSDAVRT